MTCRQTRAERAATPLARDSIRKIAESVGGCLRPVQLRRTDTATGQTVPVMVPCGATLASICPPCADRAKTLRAAQCRDGWHLEDEPDLTPGPPDEMQEFCLILRAEAQLRRDTAAASGGDTSDYDQLIDELDIEITRARIRGTVTNRNGSGKDGMRRGRRSRSTRRRQDAAPLPARKIAPRTVGRVYTARRQEVPAVYVYHLDLRQLRQGQRRRHPGRPGQLRLCTGGAGCDPFLRIV